MIAEYERYHGVVLRELIVKSSYRLTIEPWDESGRVNSFCLNGRTALHIKHSSKRLPPWQFTFNEDAMAEINGLIESHPSFCLALVCGFDGVVSLTAADFRSATDAEEVTTKFIRVDRDRNTMYRVFGNSGKLGSAKPRGVATVLDEVFARGRLTALRRANVL